MRTLLLIFGILIVFNTTSCVSRVAVKSGNVNVVKVAPKHHKVVVVKGKRYYYWNKKHYKKTRKGYVFVKI